MDYNVREIEVCPKFPDGAFVISKQSHISVHHNLRVPPYTSLNLLKLTGISKIHKKGKSFWGNQVNVNKILSSNTRKFDNQQSCFLFSWEHRLGTSKFL